MISFPYQTALRNWLIGERRLSSNTATRIANSVTHFWNYYTVNSTKEATLNNINQSTIAEYLDFLEQQKNFKKSTINKYLSYIRSYFTFLYDHNLITHYPLINIKGRHFSRQHVYKINWMKDLPILIKSTQLQTETKLLLICISLGYETKSILSLKYSTIISQVNNKEIKSYLEDCKNKQNSKNNYIFETSDGHPYASQFNIEQHIMADRNYLGMQLTFQSLRRSYIYSVIQQNYTDAELLKKLHISAASLVNYRKNLIYFVKTEQFELPMNAEKTN